jgi:hypothetical protein
MVAMAATEITTDTAVAIAATVAALAATVVDTALPKIFVVTATVVTVATATATTPGEPTCEVMLERKAPRIKFMNFQ